jgi:hypothetical protein
MSEKKNNKPTKTLPKRNVSRNNNNASLNVRDDNSESSHSSRSSKKGKNKKTKNHKLYQKVQEGINELKGQMDALKEKEAEARPLGPPEDAPQPDAPPVATFVRTKVDQFDEHSDRSAKNVDPLNFTTCRSYPTIGRMKFFIQAHHFLFFFMPMLTGVLVNAFLITAEELIGGTNDPWVNFFYSLLFIYSFGLYVQKAYNSIINIVYRRSRTTVVFDVLFLFSFLNGMFIAQLNVHISEDFVFSIKAITLLIHAFDWYLIAYFVKLNYVHKKWQIKELEQSAVPIMDRRPDLLSAGTLRHNAQFRRFSCSYSETSISPYFKTFVFTTKQRTLTACMEMLSQLLAQPNVRLQDTEQTIYTRLENCANSIHSVNSDRYRSLGFEFTTSDSVLLAYLIISAERKAKKLFLPRPVT